MKSILQYHNNVAIEEIINLLRKASTSISNFKEYSDACNNQAKMKKLFKKFKKLEIEVDISLNVLFSDNIEDEFAIHLIDQIFQIYDELILLTEEIENV